MGNIKSGAVADGDPDFAAFELCREEWPVLCPCEDRSQEQGARRRS